MIHPSMHARCIHNNACMRIQISSVHLCAHMCTCIASFGERAMVKAAGKTSTGHEVTVCSILKPPPGSWELSR